MGTHRDNGLWQVGEETKVETERGKERVRPARPHGIE